MANGIPSPAAGLNLNSLPSVLQDNPLDPTLAALSTLSLLNLRLSRLEHLLTGHDNVSTYDVNLEEDNQKPAANTSSSRPRSLLPTSPPAPTQQDAISLSPSFTKLKANDIPSQLHHLETRLGALKRMDGLPGSLVRMVDTLRREYPDVFPTSSSSAPSTSALPSTTTQLSQQTTQILAHASLYTATSSRLQTLQTLRIPEASVSSTVVTQGLRVKNLLERQGHLETRVEELKIRSVAVLQWWVDVGIKGMGELWEDWEDRVAVCERFVKVYERRAREERGEEG